MTGLRPGQLRVVINGIINHRKVHHAFFACSILALATILHHRQAVCRGVLSASPIDFNRMDTGRDMVCLWPVSIQDGQEDRKSTSPPCMPVNKAS